MAVVKAVEGSPKEAPGVPSCGGHESSDAAEPFMASAAGQVKRGVCPPARTARFIASQLWGLTHVQGLSVRPVGWLGVIHTSSEDPCPITDPLLLRCSSPRVTAVFEAGHFLGIERHRLFAQWLGPMLQVWQAAVRRFTYQRVDDAARGSGGRFRFPNRRTSAINRVR